MEISGNKTLSPSRPLADSLSAFYLDTLLYPHQPHLRGATGQVAPRSMEPGLHQVFYSTKPCYARSKTARETTELLLLMSTYLTRLVNLALPLPAPPARRLCCAIPGISECYQEAFASYCHQHQLSQCLDSLFGLAQSPNLDRQHFTAEMGKFDKLKADGMRMAEK